MSKHTIAKRDNNLNAINLALDTSSEVSLDAVMSEAVKADALVTLDGLMPQGDNAHSVTDTMLASIQLAQGNGIEVSSDAIDLSISTSAMIADSMVEMDGINTADGSAIVATATAFNQYVILNSNIKGIDGNIGDMEAVKGGDKNNTKFKLYAFNPTVTKGMGDLADGTLITPQTATLNMAFAQRETTFVKTNLVLSYVFNVKAIAGGANFAIGRGQTEVVIGDTGLVLNDYEVSAQEVKPKRTITYNDKQIDMVIDYVAGTVTVTLEDNVTLSNDVKIYVTSAVSVKEISKVRGFVGSDIADFTYVAMPVTLGVEASMMDIRQVNQAVKHAILPIGLQVAGQKIATELIAQKIDKASRFATRSGTPIDLSVNRGLATTAEAYKLLTVGIDRASVEILEESMLTDKVTVIGGKGLVDAFGMMAKNTDGMTVRDTNSANTFKFLGYLDGKYPAYYDPRHDSIYPLVDVTGAVSGTAADNVYNSLTVIGTPSDPAKRAVISGVGLPIIPVDLKINDDSIQKIALEGKIICDANKDPKARKLAKQLLFKTH
ncbi:MAG: hypothetical protein GQ474_00570 [Sulfurimonas sp.]|nr:hypothetical protein [Sulfurimonas sp.]